MVKLLTTLFLGQILSFGVFAQDKFLSGFYVTNLGDTVQGLIEYRAHYRNDLKFRSHVNSPIETITTDEIKAFGFSSGSLYERLTFSLEGFPSTPIVVKVLVKGQLNLFASQSQLIIGSDSAGHFKLMKGKSSNGSEALKNYQKNTGIFNILFQDCPAVKDAAQHSKISERRLIKLLKSYHQCRGASHRAFQPVTAKSSSRFGVFAGQNIANLSFGETKDLENSGYLHNSNFSPSKQFSFGMLALFSARDPSPVVAIETGLRFTKADFKATSVYLKEDIADYYIKETSITTIDYSRLTATAGLRITGRSNKVNPFINFGLSYNVFLSMKANVNQTTQINSSTEEKNEILEFSKGAPGFWVGGGVKLKVASNKSVFLDVNYESSAVSYSGKITVFGTRLGLLF
jgi:hypothetical protein